METKSQNPALTQTKFITKTQTQKSTDDPKKTIRVHIVISHTPILSFKTKKQASTHAFNLAIAYPFYRFYLSKGLSGCTEIIKIKTDHIYKSSSMASSYIKKALKVQKIAA